MNKINKLVSPGPIFLGEGMIWNYIENFWFNSKSMKKRFLNKKIDLLSFHFTIEIIIKRQ